MVKSNRPKNIAHRACLAFSLLAERMFGDQSKQRTAGLSPLTNDATHLAPTKFSYVLLARGDERKRRMDEPGRPVGSAEIAPLPLQH